MDAIRFPYVHSSHDARASWCRMNKIWFRDVRWTHDVWALCRIDAIGFDTAVITASESAADAAVDDADRSTLASYQMS